MKFKLLALTLLISSYTHTDILIEGKTKIVEPIDNNPANVLITSKDDITGNDGELHDIISGKAAIATDTTSNTFRLLKESGIPVAFNEQVDATRFTAPKCDMILYEVIARREAHGSYLKRNPHLEKGQLFPQLLIEFFLKTSNKEWEGHALPCDDPFIQFRDNKAYLYHPKKPIYNQEPFLVLDDYPLKDQKNHIMKMIELTTKTFLVLEKAWQQAGGKLVDFKIEFGFDTEGNLLVADVIDNDSWRVIHDGVYVDKQFYREGGDLNKVTKKYQFVRERTSQFKLPRQQIIIWRASPKDDVSPFISYLKPYIAKDLSVSMITCSMHKEPIKGYKQLLKAVQNIPNSVLVAFVGRSNGAGPTLSAQTTVPTITVPMGWPKFPEDVWSSLRTPSKVPVLTILDQQNAALAALQILAGNNPRIYSLLQMELMGRLQNTIDI